MAFTARDEAMGTLLGVGIYTLPEAARMTRIRGDRIRRWTQGYTTTTKGGRRFHAPVWRTEVERVGKTAAISFLDLMELRLVNAFVDLGVPLQKIRAAADLARELWESEHPLATRRFQTDGRTIFAEMERRDGGADLLDINRQFAMFEVVEPTLLAGVEFGEDGTMRAWHPQPDHAPRIICDQLRSFGRPIDEASGVPAEVLFQAFKVEGSVEAAAAVYEVDPEAVKDAIRFDFEMKQAA